MGQFINPPNKVKRIGRQLSGLSFPELVAQLAKDEELVGLYDRGMFMSAPNLTICGRQDDSEFWELENQAADNRIFRLGFFAVPKSAFD